MANAALFIGWGTPIPGRERQALEVFGQFMQYYGRLKGEGEIESFEPVALEPHGGDLGGFVLIQGDREKLSRLRTNPEFIHNINRAELVVHNVGVVTGYIGEDLNRLFSDYQSQIGQLT
jgi:hypothetical protein